MPLLSSSIFLLLSRPSTQQTFIFCLVSSDSLQYHLSSSHLGPPKEISRRQPGLTPRSSSLGRLQAGVRTYALAVRSPTFVVEAKRGDDRRVNGIRVLADTTPKESFSKAALRSVQRSPVHF
ncbi:hypothetical protein EV421DRAFT_510874 [Armillaria borealis]|uniref:Secreted protein n=1 Tax=Armillaria borealis TaxID=47425 RepID=A0AA39MRX3_9AGAR|nr:hypothetical protein EV421DRAFT_510874 [Armillaria borealis]